jgi:hypothetical protein
MKKFKMKMKYLKCDLAQVLLNLLRSNALVDVDFSVLSFFRSLNRVLSPPLPPFLPIRFSRIRVKLRRSYPGALPP